MNKVTHRDINVPTAPVSIGQAASLLGVTPNTVRRWEDEGKITSTRTPGGQRRFEMSEIERVRTGAAAVEAGDSDE